MRVIEQYIDVKTGEVGRREIEVSDVITEADGLVLTNQALQQEANGRTIETQVSQSLAALRAYRDLASPTNAQTVAAVKLLCRVAIWLIRLKFFTFDATD